MPRRGFRLGTLPQWRHGSRPEHDEDEPSGGEPGAKTNLCSTCLGARNNSGTNCRRRNLLTIQKVGVILLAGDGATICRSENWRQEEKNRAVVGHSYVQVHSFWCEGRQFLVSEYGIRHPDLKTKNQAVTLGSED
jgi:hypothetical protein